MQAIDPKTLTDLLSQMTSYQHYINYFGPAKIDEVATIIGKLHELPETLLEIPEALDFDIIAYQKPQVYLITYDISQVNMFLFAKDQIFDKSILPYSTVFGYYYGGGLSSVIFQEIRESRALAYSAYGFYRPATKQGKNNSMYAFVGTQPDKLEIATSALMELLNKMPRAETQYQMAIDGIIKNFNTERITGRRLFWTYLSNKDRGIDYDIRKDNYAKIKDMTIDDFETFFNSNIKGKNYGYMVMGNLKAIDQKSLSKIGEIKILSLEDIFGY
jgi:predicted Zn-dependent peptidase